MSIYQVIGEHLENHSHKQFWVDNQTLKITDFDPGEGVPFVVPPMATKNDGQSVVNRIKIQMGLQCNYSCAYCSQASVTRPDETNRKNIEPFLEMLKGVNLSANPLIEFWGGEPFVYWKTMKPLAERLRELFPKSHFSVITNGSLLTKEKVDWLYKMGFGMAISHDGPGQHVRGDDPLVDNAENFRYCLERMLPEGRVTISSVLNRDNTSRVAIIDFWRRQFPELNIRSTEMEFIDSYDEAGGENIAFTKRELFEVRRNLWAELRFVSKVREHCPTQSEGCESVFTANSPTPVSNCTDSHCSVHGAEALNAQVGQKCGMELPSSLAVDLKGNILTCQNVSAVSTAANGNSHKLGHLTDEKGGVQLNSVSHWSERSGCPTCPVLRICKGSCMFLQGDNFYDSCETAYTDAITKFAVGFEQTTGYVPVRIVQDGLPRNRQDIWGTLEDWEAIEQAELAASAKSKRVVIPIKSI